MSQTCLSIRVGEEVGKNVIVGEQHAWGSVLMVLVQAPSPCSLCAPFCGYCNCLLSQPEADSLCSVAGCHGIDGRCWQCLRVETLMWACAGCGGHKLSDIEDDQKVWIAEAASHHGYGRVTVESRGSLLWEYVRNKDGRVHDSVRISNSQLDRRRCNAALTGTAAQNQTAGGYQGPIVEQQLSAAVGNLTGTGLQLPGARQDSDIEEKEESIATA